MPVSHFVKAVLDDQRTRFFLSALFVASLLYLLASTATTAKRSQENGSRKVKLQEFKDIPLRLVEVRHLDSDTWYNDLEIELKNISTKRIYYVLAYLDFPDIPVPDGMYGIPLFFGEDKNSDYRRDPEPNDPYLKPGDTLTFTIPENVRKGIKRHYESLPATVQKLELHISLISFGDGTGFVAERPRDRRVKYAHTQPRKRNHSNRKSSTSTAEPLQDGCGSCARYVLGPREVLCYSGGPCFGKRATTDPSAKCALIKPHFFECGELNCYSDDIYESPICPGFTATPTPSPTPEETPTPCVPGVCGDTSASQVDYCAFPPYGCPDNNRPNGSCCYPPCPPITKPPCNGFLVPPRPGACFYTCIPRSVIASEVDCTDVDGFWNFASNTCNDTPQTQVQCATADWYWNFTSNGCVPAPAEGMCGGGPDWGNYPSSGCFTSGLGIFGGICNRSNTFISKCFQDNGDYDNHYCTCGGCDWCGGSPTIIDVSGNRYDMTDLSHGVTFDLNGNGTADKLSWTKPGSSAMWLTLDGNHNGTIDSGKELFGNFTFQSEPPARVEKNGFRALAEYDKPENGGNADGNIDAHDAVWSRLRLWQDANQNGVSEPAELRLLSEFGIESISLDYKESRHRDRYGNEFRYRARVYGANHQDLGRWAYDVFLQSTK